MMMRMSGQKSGRGQTLSTAAGADGTGLNMVQYRLTAHHIITYTCFYLLQLLQMRRLLIMY